VLVKEAVSTLTKVKDTTSELESAGSDTLSERDYPGNSSGSLVIQVLDQNYHRLTHADAFREIRQDAEPWKLSN
jgi:hypothetical protein